MSLDNNLYLGTSILSRVEKRVLISTVAEMTARLISEKFGFLTHAPYGASEWKVYMYGQGSPSPLSFDQYENAVESSPSLDNYVDVTLQSISSKLTISRALIEEIDSNQLGLDISVQRMLEANQYYQSMQAEEFAWTGESAPSFPSPKAPGNAKIKTPGWLFDPNVDVIGAGASGNDDVSAYGDFIGTFSTIYNAAKSQGVDPKLARVFMDPATFAVYMTSISTSGFMEAATVSQAKIYDGWKIEPSTYILPNSGVTHVIAAIFPEDTKGQPTCEYVESISPNYTPIANGGLMESGKYGWMYSHKLATAIRKKGGIIRSGNLTIT
jgi:hypothetical protein